MIINKKDIFFAILAGLLVSWLAVDFLGALGFIFVIAFPVLSVLGLWLTTYLGKRAKFIDEAGRFFLVGAFADVIDIKTYQFIFFLLPFPTFVKAISFLVATIVKYWWNKHWAFNKEAELENKKIVFDKQIILFFAVTLVGLGINVVSFYFFDRIEAGLEHRLWTEVSIILSALVSAIWNFLGYKFLVFKNDKSSII